MSIKNVLTEKGNLLNPAASQAAKSMKCMLLSLLFLWGSGSGMSAQQVISINSGSSIISKSGIAGQPADDSHPGRPEQARRFDYNPRLKSLTRENVGDILLLDFFNDREYRATVKSVTRDCNGVTGIVATIWNERFGYCYISVSESGILINAELPEANAYFLATGDGRLSEYKMSEVMKNDLGCDALEPPVRPEPALLEPAQTKNAPVAAAAGNEEAPATIKVLVVYTSRARNYANASLGGIGQAINDAIGKANETASNSGTGVTFELAHSYETSYTEVNSSADLDNLTDQGDGYLDEVHDIRREKGADLVMLVADVEFTGGIGWLLSTESGMPGYGFALTRVKQLIGYTAVHEMGHNMGCHHHKGQKKDSDPGPGLYSYSAGWKGFADGGHGNICTVMTYANQSSWDDGSSYRTIPYFSNPNITYPGSTIQIGDADDADNARTLRQTKHTVANYSEIVSCTVLTGLKVNGTSIQGFNSNTRNYSVTVSNATVTIEGTAGCGSVSGNVTNVPLNYGANSFTISVSGSGMTNSYTVTVNYPLPSCASYASRPAFGNRVEAAAGNAALNLNMTAAVPCEAKTSLVMIVSPEKSGRIIMWGNSSRSSCGDGNNYSIREAMVKVKVMNQGSYTFSDFGHCILSVFDSDNISCSSFFGSNSHWTEGSGFSYNFSLSLTLNANKYYYLRVVNWSGFGEPVCNISVSGAGAGSFLVESAIPSGMGYTYVAVDKSDSRIKLQSAVADFRTLTAGNYTIYGIPYSTGSNPTTFVGKTLASIQSSDCAIPSATSLEMTVTQGLYNINYGSFTDGSVIAKPETNITAGTPVTITLHPSPGYKLETLETTPKCALTGTGTGEGDTRTFNMPSSNVTITAKFQKTQEQLDAEAVAAAETAIMAENFTVTQQTANTEDAVKTWLVAPVNSLITSSTGITITANDITINNFTPATEGNNCSYSFTVKLSKGSADGSVTKDGTILSITVYSINVGMYANGRITADKTVAAQDETVTLTISPDDEYRLASITAHKTGTPSTTVTVNGTGDTRTFTMPAYDVTLTAEFQRMQEQLDREAVEAAKDDIENSTFRIIQAVGNTEATVKDGLIDMLKALFGDAHGIEFRSATIPMIGEVTLTLTPAVAGTETSPAGTDGSFRFTVELTRGAATLRTGEVEGKIIATPYSGTGNDNPQEQGLKARMQNGRLHISGLTAGKPWRVYNFSGALICHGVAGDEEENIDLSVRGLYIVVSGSQSVKVMFR
jgi:hypothetical protein